jgi:uncharacterized Fe-S cluster-containing radical SAM superfamily enzyme
MEHLKKVIYKFLDNYIGDGIKVKYNPIRKAYNVYSDKGILVLSFGFNFQNSIIIFRGLELCNMVCRFFSVGDDEAMRYVRNWFADKHNINKVSDLTKFIPNPVSS